MTFIYSHKWVYWFRVIYTYFTLTCVYCYCTQVRVVMRSLRQEPLYSHKWVYWFHVIYTYFTLTCVYCYCTQVRVVTRSLRQEPLTRQDMRALHVPARKKSLRHVVSAVVVLICKKLHRLLRTLGSISTPRLRQGIIFIYPWREFLGLTDWTIIIQAMRIVLLFELTCKYNSWVAK